MAGTLTFLLDDNLRAIIDHARTAPEISPNFAELVDPACRFDGLEPSLEDDLDAKDVDQSKLKRGLWLAKDDAVYLMSPGKPHLPGGKGTVNAVAYAVETNPDDEDCHHAASAIMGGDDGCDKLDLELFEKAVRIGARAVTIMVTETSLDVRVQV